MVRQMNSISHMTRRFA